MGFRKGAYCTVWSVDPVSDTVTKARVSISRKDKQTGEYVEDFSGFVTFFGTATARKATTLKERDRIQLDEVDVGTKYDKAKNVTYYNFKVFSFDVVNNTGNGNSGGNQPDSPQTNVDDGIVDDSRLPF